MMAIINNDRKKAVTVFLDKYLTGKILDVGCLDGHMTMHKENVTYLDIEKQDNLFKFKRFIKHDLNKFPLPFKDNTFNTVFAAGILEHLEAPYLNLLEFKRVLKPGGIVVMNLPNVHFIGKYLDPRLIETAIVHINLICDVTMANILRKQGWNVIDCKFGWLLTGSPLIGKLWQWLPRFLQNEYWLVAVK